MESAVKGAGFRERAAALVIVLAFVVLLTGLAVAYLSRATGDRHVAQSSFHQSKVDQLAQSAMDNIIGDLRQEIANGSVNLAPGGTPAYSPTAAANMVPKRSGNVAGASNLIRRSVRSDAMSAPGLPSRASAVNSTTDVSAEGRYVTAARWNTHYLVPKKNTGTEDSIPIDAFANATPDWVFVTSNGGAVITSPSTPVVGRYAYAIYDESGLLDLNVAGYPNGTTATQSGRKGSLAFADLRALGNYPLPNDSSPYQVDILVGWRNYATTLPLEDFPDTSPPGPPSKAFARNFRTSSTAATNFYNSVVSNTSGFLSARTDISPFNERTDQMFVGRQQLTSFRRTTGFSVNALQYLTTSSRENNSPSFSPSTPSGSTIDYAALASTSTAVNPNFSLRRVTTSFTRFDGTTAAVGEPLVKTRFPLSRLAWITYKGPSALRTLPPQTPALPTTDSNYDMWALQWTYGVPASYLQAGTAANIKACFGLVWDSRTYVPATGTTPSIGQQWVYDSPSAANGGGAFDPSTNPGGSPASAIKTLATVAIENREPDFFELLRATTLDGSLGQNTGGGVTGSGVSLVFPDVHMSNRDHHILSIGAAMIDQTDPDSLPTRIQFKPTTAGTWWTAYGVENLPYITQLYPIAGTSPNDPTNTKWATYLLFQLWNAQQTVVSALSPVVRLRADGAIGIFQAGNGETWLAGTAPQIIANGGVAGQSITLNSAFSTSAPLTNGNTTNAAALPGPPTGGVFAVLAAPPVPSPTP
jgi:hypothetical protein